MIFVLIAFFSLFSPASDPALEVNVQEYPDHSRITLLSSFPLNFALEKKGASLQVRIETRTTFRLRSEPPRSRFVRNLRWAKGSDFYLLTIETRHDRFWYRPTGLEKSRQLVLDLFEGEPEKAEDGPPISAEEKENLEEFRTDLPPSPAAPSLPPPVESSPGKEIMTIVIDPGHGGLETGAKGKLGNLEKDITLAIALKLKAVIEKNLAFRVVLTRDRDMDVSLDQRAATANNNKASLFISIHANSSYRKKANGSETFFLSLNATDEEARRLAYFENSSSEFENQIEQENQDQIMMILWDMAQSAYLKQSEQLAEFIQIELNSLLGTVNRGIKQAPFKVLMGVACPAVLVEAAFISNQEEERALVRDGFQENVAQAIYRGLAHYLKMNSR